MIPLRLEPEEEEKGCDIVEHDINGSLDVTAHLRESMKLQTLNFNDQNQFNMPINFQNLHHDETSQNFARQRGIIIK